MILPAYPDCGVIYENVEAVEKLLLNRHTAY